MNIQPKNDTGKPLRDSEDDGPWLRRAQMLARGAERARAEGDIEASLALAFEGVRCLRIHKNLRGID